MGLATAAQRIDAAGLFAASMMLVWWMFHPADSTGVESGDALGGCAIVLGWVAIDRMLRMLFAPASIGRIDTIDAAAYALGLWMMASAWFSAGTGFADDGTVTLGGSWRSGGNEAWLWITGAAWLTTMRRSMRSGSNQRAMLGLLLVIGVMLATDALYQTYISLPESLRSFLADPDGQLARIGLDAPPGSAARMVFENRLRDGGPTATFALANSLAGVLAMAASMTLAMLLGSPRAILKNRVAAPLGAAALVLVWAIWQTGSRGALAAFTLTVAGMIIAGGLVHAWTHRQASPVQSLENQARPTGQRRTIAWLVGGSGGLIAACVAVWVVFRNSPTLSTAPASIAFRWQYWTATWSMVLDHPWWGIGPGNFQVAYQVYRDVSAHETIAEPHHFAFETIAAGGLIAGGLLVVILAAVLAAWWRGDPVTNAAQDDDAPSTAGVWFVSAGFVAGWLWVWCNGLLLRNVPDIDAGLWSIFVGGLLGGWWVWDSTHSPDGMIAQASPLPDQASRLPDQASRLPDQASRLPDQASRTNPWRSRTVALFGLVAAGLHLSFSGGLTVPGVSAWLWTLAAIVAAPPRDRAAGSPVTNKPIRWAEPVRWAEPMIWAIACFVLVWFSWLPVRQSALSMASADAALRRGQTGMASAAIARAMADDPRAIDPAMWNVILIARQSPPTVGPSTDASTHASTDATLTRALDQLRGRMTGDPKIESQLGDLFLHRYQIAGRVDDLAAAWDAYAAAVSHSPTHQAYVAQTAEIQREIERIRPSDAVPTSLEIDWSVGRNPFAGEDARPPADARSLADWAARLAQAGGVLTRRLSLQPILPARVIGATVSEQPLREPADVVLDRDPF